MDKNYLGEKSLRKKATKVKILLSIKPKRRSSVRRESTVSNSHSKRRSSVLPTYQDSKKKQDSKNHE